LQVVVLPILHPHRIIGGNSAPRTHRARESEGAARGARRRARTAVRKAVPSSPSTPSRRRCARAAALSLARASGRRMRGAAVEASEEVE
jgi:hypothetical protein